MSDFMWAFTGLAHLSMLLATWNRYVSTFWRSDMPYSPALPKKVIHGADSRLPLLVASFSPSIKINYWLFLCPCVLDFVVVGILLTRRTIIVSGPWYELGLFFGCRVSMYSILVYGTYLSRSLSSRGRQQFADILCGSSLIERLRSNSSASFYESTLWIIPFGLNTILNFCCFTGYPLSNFICRKRSHEWAEGAWPFWQPIRICKDIEEYCYMSMQCSFDLVFT